MYEVYQDHPKQARLNIRVVLAVAFLVCAIGAGIFLITRLVSKQLTKEDARGQTGIVYDSSAVEGGWDNLSPEEIAEKLNEKVAEGMINISMNTAPYFENGASEGNVMIVNEAINNYPQQVEFIRNDTQEVIYQSKAIPVGTLLNLTGSTSIAEYREGLLHLKSFEDAYDEMWAGHDHTALPKKIVDDGIALCERILARTDDAIETEDAFGGKSLLAAARSEGFRTKCGSLCNIVYKPETICKSVRPIL